MKLQHILILFVSVLLVCSPVQASERYALVIGNAKYPTAPLANPVNDVDDMGAKFAELGFQVTKLLNASQRSMEDAIDAFTRNLTGKNTVGVFFYAGHGLEVEGENYLVPVDAELRSEEDVKYKTVNAGQLLDRMRKAGNGLNLVILDACRDNPFKRSWRSLGSNGLAKMQPKAAGTLILYAAEPGKEAKDGDGRNGIFTQHLLAALDVPGVEVELAFKEVSAQVSTATTGKQVPWFEGVIHGHFMFRPSDLPTTDTAALAKCQEHLQANRLISGAGGNAFDCYRSLLEQEPANIAARAGLTAIIEKYQYLAKDATKRKRSKQAQDLVAKAEIVRLYINGLLPPSTKPEPTPVSTIQPPQATPESWTAFLEQLGTILIALITLLGVVGQVWWSRSKQKCPPARLVELSVPKGQVYRLKAIKTQIGRKGWRENAIRIANDSISRHHACIEYSKTEQVFYLVDLGSTHGVKLNGCDLPKGGHRSAVLKHGDELMLAGLRFGFLIDSETNAEKNAIRCGTAIETTKCGTGIETAGLSVPVDLNATK